MLVAGHLFGDASLGNNRKEGGTAYLCPIQQHAISMRSDEPALRLEDYDYPLPETAIAKFPAAQRDQSKLLVYRQGKMADSAFHAIPNYLPSGSHLFFNDTKVIPARLHFQKEASAQGAGAQIELFLLHPVLPSSVMSEAMATYGACTWQCMVGNRRRWKSHQMLERVLEIDGTKVALCAQQTDKADDHIRFTWDDHSFSFAEVVEAAGQVPLPPYLKRTATQQDKPRYQTVYSAQEGAVAAPTAGLHFTDTTLQALQARGIEQHYLTLHVSAGTFQPIKEADITQHPMHAEQLVVTLAQLEGIRGVSGPVIAVGTTSLRILESLYWYGVLLHHDPEAPFRIAKLTPYQYRADSLPTFQQSIERIIAYLKNHRLQQLVGETEIFIFPGYQFRACQGLITNFHLPKSTLILLIAAFIGDDWRQVYQHALQHGYRFLSYGDSSLLLPSTSLAT